LKQLYRAIVKALHPDLNPGLSEAKIQLFHHAVEAYKNGDLVRLRMISFMIEDPVLPNEKTDVYKQLQEEKKRLTDALSNVREKIAEIKSAFPYTMKSFLQNPERVAARKAELNAAIQQLKEWQAYYTDRIQHMLR
jgi:peptidoglycan hydrolase CwlO-like protein